MKKIYTIDGDKFDNFEEFCDHLSWTLLSDCNWGGNLDALNDILRGGFGTPEEGFIIKWKNSSRSRDKLGYEETARRFENILEKCHPSNIERLTMALHLARKKQGQTLFELLVEIFLDHGSHGTQSESGVELVLL